MLEDLVGINCPTLPLYRQTDVYSERWDGLLQVLCFRCETRLNPDIHLEAPGLLIDGFMGLQHAMEWGFRHRGQASCLPRLIHFSYM